MFEEGSFIGKCIYDIEAFEQALHHRLPENRILSHDLLEGCYARAGLVSDVQLYEEYPSLYSADVSRRHRWIRGDWQIASYKVEPYVMAAYVYAVAPHVGRGGWTWYTGSAGWMYRLIVESLLGLTIEDGYLQVSPCIPEHWPTFKISYRYHSTHYEISVSQSATEDPQSIGKVISLDGVTTPNNRVALIDDRALHRVTVALLKVKINSSESLINVP